MTVNSNEKNTKKTQDTLVTDTPLMGINNRNISPLQIWIIRTNFSVRRLRANPTVICYGCRKTREIFREGWMVMISRASRTYISRVYNKCCIYRGWGGIPRERVRPSICRHHQSFRRCVSSVSENYFIIYLLLLIVGKVVMYAPTNRTWLLIDSRW